MVNQYLKKIIAQSPEDLHIISACCSEGKVSVKDLKYLELNKIFLMSILRFSKEEENKNKSINMKLIDGPFKYLDGVWEFKSVDDKTIIYLSINYEAENKLIEYTIGKSLDKITNYLVKAFTEESLKQNGE